jgi:rubrerythrin
MKTITKNCRECGKTFSLTPENQQHFIDKGLQEPTRCPRCREKRRNVEYITCKDCGEQFGFNELEKEFYQKNGFELPKRCPVCRQKRREQKEVAH